MKESKTKIKLVENIEKGKIKNTGLPEIFKSYCKTCWGKEVLLTRLPSHPVKRTISCKMCGITLNGAKYARCCKNCKLKSITCVNCIPCAEGHQTFKCMDLTMHGKNSQDGLYHENKYGCDLCGLIKHVRPYVFRCIPCEIDMCPNHFFRGNQVLKEPKYNLSEWEVVEVKEFSIPDPHWDIYTKRAIKDGIPEDQRETEYYGKGLGKVATILTNSGEDQEEDSEE